MPTPAPDDDDRAASSAPLLEADGLWREVEGRELWGGVDLRLTAGERVAIRGPSGSGKTLLLRTLAGLEPRTAGRIRLDGVDQEAWSMPAYRARVMLVAQRPSLPEGTVERALAAPFAFRSHAGRRFDRARAERYLAGVGRTAAFLDKETGRLSGGEQQLAALLRALALEPEVLLLDEPTASLDGDATAAVEDVVAAWLGGGGRRAFLWTSHDPVQLRRVSDRSITLGAS